MDESARSASIGRPGERTRTVMRALSNVLLGIAVGIGCYYGITDIVSTIRQRQLLEVVDVGELAAPDPSATLDADALDPLDFTDWETQDVVYWEGLEEGDIFGRLVIERMDLDTFVVKGTSRASLKEGPGWIDWSDLPGPTGNTGISGHRTTYGAPFRKLDQLLPGDTIDLYSPYRRYRYEVMTVFAVRPDQVEVVESTEDPQLTLTACHPPFSAAQRLIAQARLVEVRRVKSMEGVVSGKDAQ